MFVVQVYRGKWRYADIVAKEYPSMVNPDNNPANQQLIGVGRKVAWVGCAGQGSAFVAAHGRVGKADCWTRVIEFGTGSMPVSRLVL
jgi:hypothetical protein